MTAGHPAAGLASLGGQTMGTRWSARVAVPASADLHALHAQVQVALDEVVAQMSTWQADSDISRYRAAGAGTWQPLPQAFAAVLDAAIEVARASGGAFDPTIAPLVELWGFGHTRAPRQVPDPALLEQARARTGWQRLQRRGLTRSSLYGFHARYKYQLMATSRAEYQRLGRLLAESTGEPLQAFAFLVEMVRHLFAPLFAGGFVAQALYFLIRTVLPQFLLQCAYLLLQDEPQEKAKKGPSSSGRWGRTT